jgi:hypothetical protein
MAKSGMLAAMPNVVRRMELSLGTRQNPDVASLHPGDALYTGDALFVTNSRDSDCSRGFRRPWLADCPS